MKKLSIAFICFVFTLSSCVMVKVPPGQAKKNGKVPPGQMKKATGSKSAAAYASGQQKKATGKKKN